MRGLTGPYATPMSDYPDWQVSAATQSGNVFPAFTQTLTPGNHPGPVTPVFSWQSLNMIVVPTAGAGKVTVTHYADAAGTLVIGSDTWNVSTATALTVRVPLRGPYAALSINVTSAGNLTAKTWGTYQTAQADRVSFPISGQFIFDASHTLAAGASITYTMQWVVGGRASIAYVPFDNTGQLDLWVQAVNELGTVLSRVIDLGNPTGVVSPQFNTPDAILQVVVTNNDAVNPHSYGFSFTVPPQ